MTLVRRPGHPRDEEQRRRIAEVLDDPAHANDSHYEVARLANAKYDMVRQVRRERGEIAPRTPKKVSTLHGLAPRHVTLLENLFVTGLRGGAVRSLLASDDGQELRRVVMARTDGPRLVILESPYAGEVEANVAYARACMSDSLARGEAPYASHLLYTQVLDDTVPEQRAQGIAAGLAWRHAGARPVFYIDRGYSTGMLAARDTYEREGIFYEVRRLAGGK